MTDTLYSKLLPKLALALVAFDILTRILTVFFADAILERGAELAGVGDYLVLLLTLVSGAIKIILVMLVVFVSLQQLSD